MFNEQSAPYVQAAGYVRLAIRIQAQPRSQQHHVGVGAEHRTRRARAGDFSSDGGIKSLHALRVCKIILNRPVRRAIADAGDGVEIASQPAVVPDNQALKEWPRSVGPD